MHHSSFHPHLDQSLFSQQTQEQHKRQQLDIRLNEISSQLKLDYTPAECLSPEKSLEFKNSQEIKLQDLYSNPSQLNRSLFQPEVLKKTDFHSPNFIRMSKSFDKGMLQQEKKQVDSFQMLISDKKQKKDRQAVKAHVSQINEKLTKLKADNYDLTRQNELIQLKIKKARQCQEEKEMAGERQSRQNEQELQEMVSRHDNRIKVLRTQIRQELSHERGTQPLEGDIDRYREMLRLQESRMLEKELDFSKKYNYAKEKYKQKNEQKQQWQGRYKALMRQLVSIHKQAVLQKQVGCPNDVLHSLHLVIQQEQSQEMLRSE